MAVAVNAPSSLAPDDLLRPKHVEDCLVDLGKKPYVPNHLTDTSKSILHEVKHMALLPPIIQKW